MKTNFTIHLIACATLMLAFNAIAYAESDPLGSRIQEASIKSARQDLAVALEEKKNSSTAKTKTKDKIAVSDKSVAAIGKSETSLPPPTKSVSRSPANIHHGIGPAPKIQPLPNRRIVVKNPIPHR